MYQNIFHFSGKLPEKVNFDIWVSLKVRCRDYEETCQARQLSAATWSPGEFSPRRRRCTWFCSWFFLALCCTLFLSEQTWRHPTPLVATFVALWCSNCQHLCTGQYQVRHLSMSWFAEGYWFEHYCYFLWRIHSDHQQHFVLYFCGGPRSLPGKFSFSDKFDGREARPLKI